MNARLICGFELVAYPFVVVTVDVVILHIGEFPSDVFPLILSPEAQLPEAELQVSHKPWSLLFSVVLAWTAPLETWLQGSCRHA